MSKKGPETSLTSAPERKRYDDTFLPLYPSNTPVHSLIPGTSYPESMLPAFALSESEVEKTRVEKRLLEIEKEIQLLQAEKDRLTKYRLRLR